MREAGDSTYTPSSSQPLNPNMPYSPDGMTDTSHETLRNVSSSFFFFFLIEEFKNPFGQNLQNNVFLYRTTYTVLVLDTKLNFYINALEMVFTEFS